ncbi:MAG: dephospho-CoA kinase [Gemmatimonadales bacterium]|nr:dephospho-CoA kinase [Gemmatimonadales bacterium]
MIQVALTGNVAAGKSSVAQLFADWGAVVIDADAIVHDLQRPGTAVFSAMVDRFGPGILRPDGGLERPALRRRILEDPGARAALEAIVHPAVAREREARIAEARRAGATVVVSDIPLLFEVADPEAFDLVVLVDAPEAVRHDRLTRVRGLPPTEADRLIAAQMPSSAKRARSSFVIDNDGSREALEAAARAVWDRIVAAAARA